MAIEQWLPLTDYASKYRISVSTLRRRIKNEQIKHRFDDGKYMLLDLIPDQLDHGFLQQQPLEPVLTPISAAQFLHNLGFTKPQQEFDVAKALDSEPVLVKMDSQLDGVTTHESELDSHPPGLDIHAPVSDEPVDTQSLNLDTHLSEVDSQMAVDADDVTTQVTDEPLLTSATRLLSELKRAYMNILQEKEESIIQLKEEVSDLKTLVRVLEDDNERMRKFFDPPR